MIYTLQLSNKEKIQISESEFQKFKDNIGANFIEFSNGIVNPSFVVCAVVDVEASREEARRLRRENVPLEIGQVNPDRGTKKMAEVLEQNRPYYLMGGKEEGN